MTEEATAAQQLAQGDTEPYKVLTGVPVPEGRAKAKSKYPFDTLEPGQSFFVPGETSKKLYALCAQRNSRAKDGKRFVCRAYTHEDAEGYMVWRVN